MNSKNPDKKPWLARNFTLVYWSISIAFMIIILLMKYFGV